MKRATCLGYLAPLLALAGCGDLAVLQDPLTPAAVDEGVPSRVDVDAPARRDVVTDWQLPVESPWMPYEKLTLPSVLAESSARVSLPHVEELDEVRLAHRAASRVAREGLPARTAYFVDLSGAASVAFAYTLTNAAAAPLAVVPTFNNWPAEDEVVPAEQTLAAMIAMPPRRLAAEEAAAPPVFLFDSWRLAYKEEDIDPRVIDNRYMLTTSDLPSADVLRAQGISQIVYLVGSPERDTEEDDLHDVFAAYEEAGILIYLVDLESLTRVRDPEGDPEPEIGPVAADADADVDVDVAIPWYIEARARCFRVRPRVTVVRDPRFYHRARGGFGGAHLLPVPGGHVHFGFASGG